MSGSAKAGTIAERHTCELRVLPKFAVRAPPKRASGGIFFSLTKTYMEVGKPQTIPDPLYIVTRRVSVLVSVRFEIPCVLLRFAALVLIAKPLRLQDNAT
jgi:hypothetical protein